MAGKKKVRRSLIEGATQGLVGTKLYAFVKDAAPGVPNKKIVHTALMTLTDPDLTDRKILNVIYDLAIKYRLGEDAANEAETIEAKSSRRPSKRRRPHGEDRPTT